MAQGFTRRVKAILRTNGCSFVRNGKGDHEVWHCPLASRPVVVDGKIMSRATANAVLKQAGIDEKI